MSATDELRRMLDERGVEYRIDFDGSTEWDAQTGDYSSAVDVGDGKLVFTGCLTPLQAIAATLGSGTCKRIFIKDWLWKCSECGSRHDSGNLYNYCPNCGRKVMDE